MRLIWLTNLPILNASWSRPEFRKTKIKPALSNEDQCMMEIISPPTEVTQTFNSLPLRFKMHETNSEDTHSSSPSPPGLESVHAAREDSPSTCGSPSYPKASSASTIPYPSPPILPPLDLSSVPMSPEKDTALTEAVRLRRPASAGVPPNRSSTNQTPVLAQKSSSESLLPNSVKLHSDNSSTLASKDQNDSTVQVIKQTRNPNSPAEETTPHCSEASQSPTDSDHHQHHNQQQQMTDWNYILQNFTNFCQGKIGLPGSIDQHVLGASSIKKARTDGDMEPGSNCLPSPDTLSQFQTMLLNMGQMLFNSQSNPIPNSPLIASPAKSGDDTNEIRDQRSDHSNSEALADLSSPTMSAIPNYPAVELNSTTSQSNETNRTELPLPVSLPGIPNSVSTNSEFQMAPQSSLAFTASLLAMLAAQNGNMNPIKSIRPSLASNEFSPFAPATSMLLQNPFVSGSLSSNQNAQGNQVSAGPFSSSRVPPVFPNNTTNPCNLPFFSPPIPSNKFPGLPDNRELLYQLGQQLMAMAASSGAPSEISVKPPICPWSPTNNSSCGNNHSNNNSGANQSSDSHPLSGFSSPNAPFLSNPMAAIIGSSLFGTQPFPLSNSSVNVPVSNTIPVSMSQSVQASCIGNDRKSVGLLPNSMHDKPLHPGCLPGAGNSLSGISMRGNQKYSAYYQHQRKQGFHQVNTNTMDYTATGSGSRRQGTPLATPLSGSRYASRRFRGNLVNTGLPTHSMNLDARGVTMNTTAPGGSRCSGGVRAPGTSMFPGFRGSGPYGNNTGSVSVSSAIPITSTPTHNTVVKHTLPNGGPIAKHLPTGSDPMQYATASGCAITSSGSSLSITGTSETSTARHRDTAFLCNCGQDFESLYVFTLHMKDTGHKPKSDQSERDIPKLVRGQDMWINSETEQTREILRCMRCHQSFRNLPELTMHMMKTNHYSEIVYNDSGRLVFVNPDDPHHPHSRRGSANPTATPSGGSPGKSPGLSGSPGHWLGRKGSRGMSVSAIPTTSSQAIGHTNQSVFTESQPVGKSHVPRSVDSEVQIKSDVTTESTVESHDFHATKESDSNKVANRVGKNTELNKAHSLESVSRMLPVRSPNSPDHQSSHTSADDSTNALTVAAERDSPKSLPSTKPENSEGTDGAESEFGSSKERLNKETSVLRQIETFVENNLPRTPKGLSVKVDQLSSNASHRSVSSPLSTPSTDVSSRYSFGPMGGGIMNSTCDSTKSSPLEHRKRTHSEASLSTHESPVSSPVSDQEKRAKHETGTKAMMGGGGGVGVSASALSLTPTSPGVTSTTVEFSGPLRENPLSSLQKLVETTNKPVPPSAAFSTPTGVTASGGFSLTSGNPPSLFVSCNGSGSSKSGTISTATSNIGRVSHTNGSSSSGPSSGPRSLGSPMDTTSDSSFPLTTSTASHSPGSQFAPIVLPTTETENLIPALSALYAYVEKSSSTSSGIPNSSTATQSSTFQQHHAHQSQDTSMNTVGPGSDCVSPYRGDDKAASTDQLMSQAHPPQESANLTPDKLAPNPALQAIYAAAMSTLAAQYLTTQQGSVKPSGSLGPLQAIKQAAFNFQTMIGDTKSESPDQTWMKMLQLFAGKSFQLEVGQTSENDGAECRRTTGSPDEELGLSEAVGPKNQNGTSGEFDRSQSRTPIQTQSTDSSSGIATANSNCNTGTRSNSDLTATNATATKSNNSNNSHNNNNHHNTTNPSGRRQPGDSSIRPCGHGSNNGEDRVLIRTPDSNKGIDGVHSVHSSSSPSKMTLSMDTCSYTNVNHMNTRSIYSNSSNSYHHHLPNVIPSRYPSIQNRPIPTTTQSPTLMTTMITKKAKCHYCGKPFANKGQVRLHISKNKCPCLLQQSCHVAALAAAFGSDSRSLATTNTIASKSFMKDPLVSNKARNPAEEFLASLSYPTTSANNIPPSDFGDSAPSALSLLKERFQNFDLSQSPLRTLSRSGASSTEPRTGCSSYTSITKSSESDTFAASASVSYPFPFGQSQSPIIQCSDVPSIPSVSWPFGISPTLSLPFTAAPGTPTSSAGAANSVAATAAAANAGHLAAMALLAQTLVQLTSSQSISSGSPFRSGAVLPPVTAGQDSFTDPTAITVAATAAAAAAAAAAQAAQVSNHPLTTPTSTTTSSSSNSLQSSAFINSTASFNLDLFMNQTVLMKQLAAMTNWSDPSTGEHRFDDESTQPPNPFLALSSCRNTTPNGLQ
ncbi:Protein tiptop [Fasciola hepatica]|uniref:Protein tiptop n=1 Tax=Fasciola hepatica TaxID=6192 RepID=A0A4E0RUA4_FASHE|nr:Protein tiptop [Fasciola hepatica]